MSYISSSSCKYQLFKKAEEFTNKFSFKYGVVSDFRDKLDIYSIGVGAFVSNGDAELVDICINKKTLDIEIVFTSPKLSMSETEFMNLPGLFKFAKSGTFTVEDGKLYVKMTYPGIWYRKDDDEILKG